MPQLPTYGVTRWLSMHAVVCCALWGLLHPASSRGDDQALVEEIKQAWAAQAAEVQSARIRIRHVSWLSNSKPSRSSVAVAFDRLGEVEKRGDEDELRRAIEQCVAWVIGPGAPQEWATVEVTVDGKSLRNTGIFQDQTYSDYVYKDGVRVLFEPKATPKAGFGAVAEGKGSVRRLRVEDIRMVPGTATPWSLASAAPGELIVLEHGSVKIAADPRTKMAARYSSPGHENIRGAFKEFDKEIWSPTYGIDVTFGKDGAHAVKAFLVESADFNSRIDPSEFSVSLPVGAHLADQRIPKRSTTGIVKTGGVDAIQFANQISQRTEGYFSPLRFSIFLLILLAGIAAAALGIRRLVGSVGATTLLP